VIEQKTYPYQAYYGKLFEIVKFNERKSQLWVRVLHSQSIHLVEHNLNQVLSIHMGQWKGDTGGFMILLHIYNLSLLILQSKLSQNGSCPYEKAQTNNHHNRKFFHEVL
jgi:hypothetical protein